MNYIMEGNINFTNELLKLICKDEDSGDDLLIEKCLISGEPLDDAHIVLQCGHKFNYTHILEEAKRQKKPSHLETQNIKRYQIKCPYCRKIQHGILPLRDGQDKCVGVNWPPSKMYLHARCKAILKSGLRKGHVCNKACERNYCKRHKNYTSIKETNKHEIMLCQTILRYGKRKGQKCLHKCGSNNHTCFRHLPKKDNK